MFLSRYGLGLAQISCFLDRWPIAEQLVGLATVSLALIRWLQLAFATGPTLVVFWSIPIGLFVGDGITYVTHYYMDNVDAATLKSPILAKLARDFQGHHKNTSDVRGMFFMLGTGASSVAGWPLFLLAMLCQSAAPFICLVCYSLVAMASMTPNIHMWAHTEAKAPAMVKVLQSAGILLSWETHKRHHIRVPHNNFSEAAYGLVNGWTNSVLDPIFATHAGNALMASKSASPQQPLNTTRVTMTTYIWNLVSLLPFVVTSASSLFKLDSSNGQHMMLVGAVTLATVVGVMNHVLDGTASNWRSFWNNMDTVACALTASAWIAYHPETVATNGSILPLVLATVAFFVLVWDHPASTGMLAIIVGLSAAKVWTVLPVEASAPALAVLMVGGVLYFKGGLFLHGFWHLALAFYVDTILAFALP